MKTLRRTIHPQVRVLDTKAGLVEYIASDESLDSYNEIVRADGARFDRFQKNAPFVDSHNYESIDCLIGQVVECRVSNRRVIETVKWAIDVPSNVLAQKGFEMTAAGYLKAVSIGFMPVRYVAKWDNNPTAFQDAIKELNGVDAAADVNTIYLEWQQMELSACVIGANANAVAQIEKAWRAGLLNDSDISEFSKISRDFARAFEQRHQSARTYSFAAAEQPAVLEMIEALGGKKSTHQPPQKNMSKPEFLKNFDRLTTGTKTAFENLELTRRNGSEAELQTAVLRSSRALADEQRLAGDPVDRYFAANPEQRYFWNAVARKVGGAGLEAGSIEEKVFKALSPGLEPGDGVGFGTLPVPVSEEIFDLLLIYGAFKDLGVSPMPGAFTKFVVVNGLPTVLVYPTDKQGYITTPVDNTLSGLNLGGPGAAQACNTFIGLIEASRELLNDSRVDLAGLIFRLFFQAIAGAIDYCAFQGNGNGDLTNAYQTGIFLDANIKSNQVKLVGQTKLAMLARNDFINTIGVVNSAALQRPCRWYINPKFIPALLTLKDGDGASWLLKTPADTGNEWHLVGFPVTWAAAAPGIEAANAKVAAFGEPNSYCVGIRQLFELMSSEGVKFAGNIRQIRALARGKCITRDATGFATLQLSAQ